MAGVVDSYARLAVSPDGRQVYAGSYPGGIAAFARDRRTGLLAQLPAPGVCIDTEGGRGGHDLVGAWPRAWPNQRRACRTRSRQSSSGSSRTSAGSLSPTCAKRPADGRARAVLPGELFTDREIAWKATARGHLVAALDAVPSEGGAALKCRIAEALDAVEKADQEGDA